MDAKQKIEQARQALSDMEDICLMSNIRPHGAKLRMEAFIKDAEAAYAELASKEAELVRLRGALIEAAQRIESLKRDCGADPESPIAIQNSRYMGVSSFLRAATQPPKEPT